MRAAIRLSLRAVWRGTGGPFGAVVVKDGVVVGRGWNAVTSRNDPTAHAEVMAIRAACLRLGTFTLSGCELYASCEPCPMCLGAIHWARIGRVFYANTRQDAAAIGFDDARFYAELARPAAKRRIRMRPLLRVEALAAFEAWRRKSDRVEY
ncbi:MAG: nucleoside deaminase [Verrucomicrobia bacterium]|nr:nucleoside deaminase [Verrucomicrobiota bacterium]